MTRPMYKPHAYFQISTHPKFMAFAFHFRMYISYVLFSFAIFNGWFTHHIQIYICRFLSLSLSLLHVFYSRSFYHSVFFRVYFPFLPIYFGPNSRTIVLQTSGIVAYHQTKSLLTLWKNTRIICKTTA